MFVARLIPVIAFILVEWLFVAEGRRPDAGKHAILSGKMSEQQPSADALAISNNQSSEARSASMGTQKEAFGLGFQQGLAAFSQNLEAEKTAGVEATSDLESRKTGEIQAASGEDRLAQLSSVDSSRLPELVRRFVMIHPSGALSLALLDRAVRAANASGFNLQLDSGPAQALLQTHSTSIGDPIELLFNWIYLGLELFAVMFVTYLPLWVVLYFLFVFLYKRYVTDQRPVFPEPVPDELSMESTEDFRYSILSCLYPGSSCLFGLFFPCARHADTLEAAGLGWFWHTFLAWILIDTVAVVFAKEVFDFAQVQQGMADAVRLLQGVFFAIFFASKRASLRSKFGSPSDRWGLKDCVYWCLFPECSVVQEGLQVDDAQGVDVRCCFRLYDKATGELVGEAVKEG